MAKTKFVLGTRGSALALAQSSGVAAAIQMKFPQVQIETKIIKTTGDKILETPISQIGSKGLFTKEIEDALLDGGIDFAVHSLKDLPSELPAGLRIGAVLKREEPYDCLISSKNWDLENIPSGSRVGTSALRRQAQIKSVRADLKVENLRGNLDTRLRRLREGLYDAIVVAEAGIKRLMSPVLLEGLNLFRIPSSQMLPAVGQGSLAVEVRDGDRDTDAIIEFLKDEISAKRSLAERSFLKRLQGGCQVPIGAYAVVVGDQLELEGLIAHPDGSKTFRKKISGDSKDSEKIGVELADQLFNAGGKEILEFIRS